MKEREAQAQNIESELGGSQLFSAGEALNMKVWLVIIELELVTVVLAENRNKCQHLIIKSKNTNHSVYDFMQ